MTLPDSGNGILMTGELGDPLGIDGGVGTCVCGRSISNANAVVPNDPPSVASLIAISRTTPGRALLRSSIHNGFGP